MDTPLPDGNLARLKCDVVLFQIISPDKLAEGWIPLTNIMSHKDKKQ